MIIYISIHFPEFALFQGDTPLCILVIFFFNYEFVYILLDNFHIDFCEYASIRQNGMRNSLLYTGIIFFTESENTEYIFKFFGGISVMKDLCSFPWLHILSNTRTCFTFAGKKELLLRICRIPGRF